MTAAAGVVAAAEVDELPALRGGDEQLAGVRVRERRRVRAQAASGCSSSSRPGQSSPSRRATASSPSRRSVTSRPPEIAVQPPRELRGVDPRAGQEVDLAGAVRRRHDDLRPRAPRTAPPACRALDLRLAVIGEEHDGVALEELVRPARRVEQRADRGVGALERDVGRLAAGPCACDAKSKSER